MTNELPQIYDWGSVTAGDTVAQRDLTFSFSLTGYEALMQFRASYQDPPALTFSIGSGLTVSDTVLIVQPFKAPSVHALTNYSYGLQLTAPDGTVLTALRGSMDVYPAIARAE